jgi:protein TonB
MPPVEIPTHPATGKSLWLFAVTSAVAIHAAFAALAYVHMQDIESDDLGAPGIEIALELASPQAPPSDLPPGPDSEASMASPPVVEQKTEVKDVDLPHETPVEAEDPDRIVALEKSKQPDEKAPEVKEQEANPSEQSVAQEATATPSVSAAVEADKATTIDQGTGESRQRVRVTWQKELLAHLDKHKKYPADRNQQAAQIVITMSLDRMGRVLSASVSKSSGDESFDAAALAMVQRASPVPAPPPLVADEGLSFALPVVFRVGKKRK